MTGKRKRFGRKAGNRTQQAGPLSEHTGSPPETDAATEADAGAAAHSGTEPDAQAGTEAHSRTTADPGSGTAAGAYGDPPSDDAFPPDAAVDPPGTTSGGATSGATSDDHGAADGEAAAERDVEAVLTEVMPTKGTRLEGVRTQPGRSADQAFDLLYIQQARALARQAFLLSGNRRVAARAVAYAFHTAWERWPEVARDRDPAGWVRAATYAYALSPWHRFHPKQRRPELSPGVPGDRALLEVLLTLPPSYRSALLLHDGIGLTTADAAAEAEASVAATAGRVTHARAVLAEALPGLRNAPPHERGARIARRLRDLAAEQPARLPSAHTARSNSESSTRRRTRAAVGLAALVTVATLGTALTAGSRSEPPQREHGPTDTVAPDRGGGSGEGGSAGSGEDGGSGRPQPGPMGAGMAAMDESTAYLPQLRSRNEPMELSDFIDVDKREDNLTGPPGQW